MKKKTKIALIVAGALVVAGCALAATALALGGWFDTQNPQSVTHTVDKAIAGIEVTAGAADVTIRLSDTGACYAVCDEDDRITYSLAVEGNTLYLREIDERRWYEQIGIYIGRRTVTLYLPAGVYEQFRVETQSGDVVVGDIGLSFAAVYLESSSGDINYTTSETKALEATTSSGKISLADHTANSVTAKTSSGGIELSYVRADTVTTTATSGDTHFYRVTVSDSITANSSSGNITLTASDAHDLTMSASSGNITGTLQTGKDFDAKSGSGSIRLPDSVEGSGKCMVITQSGDIRLAVSEE